MKPTESHETVGGVVLIGKPQQPTFRGCFKRVI